MRRVTLGPLTNLQSVINGLQEVELASAENDLIDIAQAYAISGTFTATRTLNVGTSTLAQTQAFLATLIQDFQRGGANRTT